MNKIWKIAFVMILLMTIAGFVTAVDDESMSDDVIASNAIQVRLEHLTCKVDFTTTQIDLIDKYFGDDGDSSLNEIISKLQDNKDTLKKDIVELGALTEKMDFDRYVLYTLKTDMLSANQNLFEFKKYYIEHEFDNGTKTDFRRELKNDVQTYNECVSDKENKMNQLLLRYNNNIRKNWVRIVDKMKNKNLSISNLTVINDAYGQLVDDFKQALDSGDKVQVKEALRVLKDSQLHLWARFETARLNGYIERLEPMVDKYDQGEQMNQVRERLNDIKPYIDQGYMYKEGDREKVRKSLHDSGEELKNMTKDMLRERLKEKNDMRKSDRTNKARG